MMEKPLAVNMDQARAIERAERLRAVVLHELAHMGRCDWLTQSLALKLMGAVVAMLAVVAAASGDGAGEVCARAEEAREMLESVPLDAACLWPQRCAQRSR